MEYNVVKINNCGSSSCWAVGKIVPLEEYSSSLARFPDINKAYNRADNYHHIRKTDTKCECKVEVQESTNAI